MKLLRRARSSPRLYAGVFLTLTIGLTANAVLTSLAEDLYLRPPAAITNQDRLRILSAKVVQSAGPAMGFTQGGFETIKDTNGFDTVAAFSNMGGIRATVGRGLDARTVEAELVSGNYFGTLGVAAALGRVIEPSDEDANKQPVAVVSDRFFRSVLGADAASIGKKSFEIDGKIFQVIGVAPEGFSGATKRAIEVWLPLKVAAPTSVPMSQSSYRFRWLSLVGRLAPAVTARAADEAATLNFRASGEEPQGEDRTLLVVSQSLLENLRVSRADQSVVWRWLALVSMVLVVIAVLNASGFLLADGLGQRREMAIRSALGGSKVRLFVDLFAKAILLALGACAVAVLLSRALSGLARSVLLPGLLGPAGPSPWVVASSISVALIGALFSAGVVAWVILRGDPALGLAAAQDQSSRSGSGLRAFLIVGQVVLTTVLVVSAHQFLASLEATQAVDLGVEVDDLWIVRFTAAQAESRDDRDAGDLRPEAGSAARASPAKGSLEAVIVDRFQKFPGVKAAAISGNDPFRWSISLRINLPGQDGEPRGAVANPVGEGYDRALGLEILEGRWFNSQDHRLGAATAVVGRVMAEQTWPVGGAVGECFLVDGSCLEIVGVVADVIQGDPTQPASPTFYVPIEQNHVQPPPSLPILVRGAANASLTAQQMRAQVASVVLDLKSVEVMTYRDALAPMYRDWRLGSGLFLTYGAVALILAGCGLMATLGLDVRRRRFEIGVRQALGATPLQVMVSVLGSGLWLVTIGVVLAGPASWAARRLFEARLYGVEASHFGSWLVAALILLAAGALACLGPASEARRFDPSQLLRRDD